ncbi:hypothetical protein WJ968_06190 [Achromobacter xylosoxidans]
MLLNFVDADIPAVLRVLAKFTGKQFLVDPRVKGTLTLVSQGRSRPTPPTACCWARCACRATRRSTWPAAPG